MSTLSLSVDQYLSESYRMTLDVAHAFTSLQTHYTAGFTKSLGRFGLGFSASGQRGQSMYVLRVEAYLGFPLSTAVLRAIIKLGRRSNTCHRR